MSITTVGGESPRKAPAASQPPPRAQVGDMGLTETEAGEALARYMESHGTGGGGDGVDLFDSDRTAEAASSRPAETPDEDDQASQRLADVDDSEDDGEDAASAAQEQQDDPEEGADLEIEVATLAAVLGVPEDALIVDEDGALSFATTVDGQRLPATFDSLVKSYQTEAAVTRRSQQVAAERQQAEQELTEKRTALDQAIQQADFMAQATKKAVEDRWARVDWVGLQQSPGEYAMLDRQREAELRSIDEQAAQLKRLYEQQMQAHQAEQAKHYAKWLDDQRQGVAEHLPELLDPAKSAELMTGFEAYLSGYGFTQAELKDLKDHRFLRVIHDAYQFRQGGAAGVVKEPKVPVAKRLAKVPRIRKPGAGSEKPQAPRTRVRNARKRLRSSGSDADAAMFAIESGIVDSIL